MTLSPKAKKFVKQGLAVAIQKRIDESRQDHIQEAIDKGRMTHEDFALFIRWLKTPEAFPTVAPPAYSPNEGWKLTLPDGARIVGNGTATLTILSQDMWPNKNDKDIKAWWEWLNSPNRVGKFSSVDMALASLDQNMNPLEMNMTDIGDSPTDLDLPPMPRTAKARRAETARQMKLFYKFCHLALDYAAKVAPKDSYAVREVMTFIRPMYEIATNMDIHPGTTSQREYIVAMLSQHIPLCNAILAVAGEAPVTTGDLPDHMHYKLDQ